MRLAVIVLLLAGGVPVVRGFFEELVLMQVENAVHRYSYQLGGEYELTQATADAVDAKGNPTNPLICEPGSGFSKWNTPPMTAAGWCSYSYSWHNDNGGSVSSMTKAGLEVTDFSRVTSEYDSSATEKFAEVVSHSTDGKLITECRKREGNSLAADSFESMNAFTTVASPVKKTKTLKLKSPKNVRSVDVALHEPASTKAQGLVAAIRVSYTADQKTCPDGLLDELTTAATEFIGQNVRAGHYPKKPKGNLVVANVAQLKTDATATVGPALTAWFSIDFNATMTDSSTVPLVTGRELCRPACAADANEEFYKADVGTGSLDDVDLVPFGSSEKQTCDDVFKSGSTVTMDLYESASLTSQDFFPTANDVDSPFLNTLSGSTTADGENADVGNKWLVLCSGLDRLQSVQFGSSSTSWGPHTADCCNVCKTLDPPCVWHSNDRLGCDHQAGCVWNSTLGYSGAGGGCKDEGNTSSTIYRRHARSDELSLETAGAAPRARRAYSSSSASGSAATAGAVSTWIWTQAAFMPPVCTGLLAVAGTTDASYDNPTATTPCSKGCGGGVNPRNAHAINELSWLLGACMFVALMVGLASTFRSPSGGEPLVLANGVLVIVGVHVVAGLWLMWDEGMSCGEYQVALSGHPQQIMSKLAWHWPHVITSEGIVWPYIVATVLAVGVIIIAFAGIIENETIDGLAAFRLVAMVAPLLTLVTMEIFVAVGTYGAMTAGRTEDPDESMHFWTAEAFAKMGEPVDRNTELAVGAWLIAVAFMVVSVGTVAIAAGTMGLTGMTADPAGPMPVTAMLELLLFPGAVILATEAAKVAKYVDDVWHGPNDSYMVTSDVLDFCASTSWIDATVSEAGMVTLYVFALAMPVALGIALLMLLYADSDGPTAAAARMVALAASAGTVALTVFIFMWQKLGHCLTVPITPAFAYFAPFFTAVGVAVLAVTAVSVVATMSGTSMQRFTAGGYFGASTKTTSFM
jgi:hypothetical protein